MTAADAQQVTNRAVLSGRKFVSRTRILVVPVMLAFILDVVPWPASETLRRLIVALISASGLPANSPQLLSRQSRIALSRRETAARYGDAAAELSHRTSAAARRAIRLMYASLVLFVLLFNFLGYNWPSALILVAFMLAAIVSASALTKSVGQASSRAIGSIADATGVTDVTIPTLPWTPEEYAAWSQARGIQAYSSERFDAGGGW